MMMRLVRKEKGIGLLELMLSLAIIAVLIIMATRYYQSARRSSQLNQAISSVNGVIAGVETWAAGKSGATPIPAITKLISDGYLPQGSDSGFGGGKAEVTGQAANFTITLKGLPSVEFCKELASRLTALGGGCGGGTTYTVNVGKSQ